MDTVASPTATALMALMSIKGIGRRMALRIVDGTNREIDHDSFRETVLATVAGAHLCKSTLTESWQRSQEQLQQSLDAGIQAFSIYDDGYPSRLRDIPDPPAVLFVRGTLHSLHSPKSMAIVGTREPTSYGVEVALRSARTAAEAGFVIVSGLAHGCDTFGHKGCLEGKGIGVAVLAHGLDRIYPAANRGLAAQLLEHGGSLVSEYPVGFTPVRTAFAERDRIQSGLSDGVLVIETDVQGGTMHTVRFARDQRRLLACIAHPEKLLAEDKTKGNQKLLKDGWASPIPDGAALIEFLTKIAAAPRKHYAMGVNVGTAEKQRAWEFTDGHI